MFELGRLDVDIKTGRDIFLAALKLLDNPQRLYRACTPAQRKMLNNVIFTKITVDTTGAVTDETDPFWLERLAEVKQRRHAVWIYSVAVALRSSTPLHCVSGSSSRQVWSRTSTSRAASWLWWPFCISQVVARSSQSRR